MSAPRELVELVAAIHELVRLAQPTPAPSLNDEPGRHRISDPTGEAAVDGGRWKRLLRRRLAEVRGLANRIQVDVTGLGEEELERWRCGCGRFQPAVNTFCGRCGKARETVAIRKGA